MFFKYGNNAISLLLALLVFTLYANSLGNGFVWDDAVVIVANSSQVHTPVELFNGIDAGRSTELTPYYRPLTLLTFYFENKLHGLNPVLVRLVNVLLHIANTLLVFRLAQQVMPTRRGAVLVALLFAAHPIHSEVVDFNSGGRNTLLATFFILSSYLLHKMALMQQKYFLIIPASFLFVAGAFSKELALVIFPFIIVLEWKAFRDTSGNWLSGVWRLIPYITFIILYFVMRNNALMLAGVSVDIFSELGSRLLNNFYIIPRYAASIIWPFLLSPRYFIPAQEVQFGGQLIISWALIAVYAWWSRCNGTRSTILFGTAWLILFWLPTSGIFPIPSAPMADRYLYLPVLGLWIVLVDVLENYLNRLLEYKWVVISASLIIVALGTITVKQNMYWRSGVTLFSRLVEQYPNQAYGYHNLGCAYMEEGRNLDQAQKEFEKAMALDPTFPRLQTQLGYIHLQHEDYVGALTFYQEAIRQNPYDGEAHLNSGIALEKLMKYQEALAEFQLFLESPGTEFPEAREYIRNKVHGLNQWFNENKVNQATQK